MVMGKKLLNFFTLSAIKIIRQLQSLIFTIHSFLQ